MRTGKPSQRFPTTGASGRRHISSLSVPDDPPTLRDHGIPAHGGGVVPAARCGLRVMNTEFFLSFFSGVVTCARQPRTIALIALTTRSRAVTFGRRMRTEP